MKKKIILKSSILAVAAGLSVFAINSVFADELPVQFMGVNDFHGALEQTGTARLEGETVKNAGFQKIPSESPKYTFFSNVVSFKCKRCRCSLRELH